MASRVAEEAKKHATYEYLMDYVVGPLKSASAFADIKRAKSKFPETGNYFGRNKGRWRAYRLGPLN